ncbi:MAG: Fic family protein [Hyphomonadaceae bacterium]|nr:Fic family protein [Hyphomonadaceae bacterium]
MSRRLDLEQLGRSALLSKLEERVQDLLALSPVPEPGFEIRCAALDLCELKIDDPLFSAGPSKAPPSSSLLAIESQSCLVGVARESWDLPCTGGSLLRDLEKIASIINAKPMSLRPDAACAYDVRTGLITYKYPSPHDLPKYLETVAQLTDKPVLATHPVASAVINWLFLYRLHPFTDGNGRLTRVLSNHFLRNFGLVEAPKVFVSAPLFANGRAIGPAIRASAGQDELLIARLMMIVEKALQLAQNYS